MILINLGGANTTCFNRSSFYANFKNVNQWVHWWRAHVY